MNTQALIDLLMSESDEDFQLANNMMEIHEIDLSYDSFNILNEHPKYNFYIDGRWRFKRISVGLYKQLSKGRIITYNSKLDYETVKTAMGEMFWGKIK